MRDYTTKPARCPGRRRVLALLLSLVLVAALAACGKLTPSEVGGTDVHHLVVLGDPHLPGPNLAAKEKVIETINGWEDVEAVVAMGDLCEYYGTEVEYGQVRSFFSKLGKPLLPIAGNHDSFFETPVGSGGGYMPGSPASQQAKLQLFRETFNLQQHYYSKQMGRYLLLFLATDHLEMSTGISEMQMDWLRSQLADHRRMPTLVFFHAPLMGTQANFKHYINKPHTVAQPEQEINALITANPQVFLWVSGHTHTPATEPSYAAPINRYANQVTNIHNADMKRETLWTNSLFLYPDRVEIRTFNHQEQRWLPELDRTVFPNSL